MDLNNRARAVRYRQLALAEPDKAKAAILIKIAEEAEQDVLCTVLDIELPARQPFDPGRTRA